jgi:hypothetical protein
MGNVWGRPIGEMKREKSEGGKEYLIIQIECPNELYGNVRAYGRLWGTAKIDAFLDFFKKNPGSSYRFRGMFSQYDKEEGTRYSNFTFYAWEAISGKEFRASFVLTGEVTAVKTLDIENEGEIYLHLFREGQGDYRDIEEDFEIYTLNAQDIAGLHEGDTIEVSGLLRAKEPEDYFGKPNGSIKPYVMGEIKIKKMQDIPAEQTTNKPF